MASIALVNVSSNERHCLNSPESVIGRGWLNCNDKRISRNHGVLKVIAPNSIAVISTHQNSLFFRRKNDIDVNQIEQNKEVNLSIGDSFGLLVDAFWFTIQPSKNENDVTAGIHCTLMQSNENESTTDGISKRKVSADLEPDSSCKRIKTEPIEYQDENVTTEASLSNDDTTQVTNEMPSTSATSSSSSFETIQQNDQPTNSVQSIKSEPLDPIEVQSMSCIKTEPMSQEENVDSTNALALVTVKTEVKSEPTDSNNDATTSIGNTHQPTLRECCRYGIRCYRRNPRHRIEEAHPGDEDYRLPNYPDPPLGVPPCPFLDRCYRRNPTHFQNFTHKISPSCGKNGYEATVQPPPERRRNINTATNGNAIDNESDEDPFATDGESDVDYTDGSDSNQS